MRRRQVACFILVALALAACSKSKDNTQLVITVWSDLVVPGEMDALRIRVMGREQTIDHPFRLSSSQQPGTFQIPVQLALVPAGNRDLLISVAAIGSYQGTDIVSQEALLPFIPDQARELVLYLGRSCKNIFCADHPGYTCENGACTKLITTDTAALPTYVPGRPSGSPDAGPAPSGTGGITRGTGGAIGSGGAKGTGGVKGAGGSPDAGPAPSGTGGTVIGSGGVKGASGGAIGPGGAIGTGGTSVPSGTGGIVTFSSGKAVGVVSGEGWVALGRDTVLTTPTCGPENTRITSSPPCQTTFNWPSTNALCVSGTIPVVANGDYVNNWGVQIGVNATDPEGGTLGQSYSTITFNYSGALTPSGASVRAELHRSGDPVGSMYCATITSGVPVLLTAFNTACWDGSGTYLQPADIPRIDQIALQVCSDTSRTYSLSSFCWNSFELGPAQGGEGSGKNILDLVPVDNGVSGWRVDRARNPSGGTQPMTATTLAGMTDLIDGAADVFFTAPYTPKEFAWQNYVNSTLPAAPEGAYLSLYILRMPSVEQATGLYAALLGSSLYSRKVGTPDDWQPTSPLMGTKSRIQDTGTTWWINFHQDVFYVEVMLDPSYGPAPDYTPGNAATKAEALRFAQAVASAIGPAPGGTGGSGGNRGSGGLAATGGTVGTGGAGGAACSNAKPCGGDLVGAWTVTSSCLTVSGELDMSAVGIGCMSAPVTGVIQVAGAWSAKSDGTYSDSTTTSGSEQIALPASCLQISGATTTCDRIGAVLIPSLGYDSVTCTSAAGGGCTCSATVKQTGGIGLLSPDPSTSGRYVTSGNVVTLDGEAKHSYCVSGNRMTWSPQSTSPTLSGTVVFQK